MNQLCEQVAADGDVALIFYPIRATANSFGMLPKTMVFERAPTSFGAFSARFLGISQEKPTFRACARIQME